MYIIQPRILRFWESGESSVTWTRVNIKSLSTIKMVSRNATDPQRRQILLWAGAVREYQMGNKMRFEWHLEAG